MTFRPSINGFSISGLKMMPGHDGYVIRCNILRDGKKVGEYFDDGNGGMPEYWPVASDFTYGKFVEFCNILPKWKNPCTGHELDVSVGIFVDTLINQHERFKRFRKYRKANEHVCLVFYKEDGRTYDGSYDDRNIENVNKYFEQNNAVVIKRYCKEEDFTEEFVGDFV